MRRLLTRKQKITKGMPSAVLLSILIHAALFLLAGMLVVFTVVKQKEVEFEPPRTVERPKMKLKKPRVKVKKSARPKSTARITTANRKSSMPNIELPEMGGIGDGLGDGGLGGFDLMPDLSGPTLFGSGQSIGNDFEGTFYDIKRDRTGKPLWSTDTAGYEWRSIVNNFFRQGWDFSVFKRYYRSPVKLYTTSFVVPVTQSALAPAAFGDKDAYGGLWFLHYKGQLVCPASYTNGITFRFWGAADEFLAVKVGGKVVLAMDWRRGGLGGTIVPSTMWTSRSGDSRKYYRGGTACEVGDWISLEPGDSLEMEVVTGGNGGVDHHILMVQEKDVDYEPAPRRGGPLLPVFKTAEFTRDKLDLIYKDLPEGEMCLTNGPVFCDYITPAVALQRHEIPSPEETEPSPAMAAAPEETMHTWTMVDGHTLAAEFVSQFGGEVVLRNEQGKTIKVPVNQLSAEDAQYVELAQPPTLDINMLKNFNTVTFSGGFYDSSSPSSAHWYRYPEQHGHFGVQLKQTSAGTYNHDLDVELFAVGQQREGSKYLLLDRQQFTFNPAREDRFKEFHSPRKLELQNYPDWYGHFTHGDKYVAYVVVVKDKRGKLIATDSPKQWLVDNLDRLNKLKVGNYFDKTCTRTFPDRPPIIPIDQIMIRD